MADNTYNPIVFDEEEEALFQRAVAYVVEQRKASPSLLERKFRIGYGRAALFLSRMEEQGIISAPNAAGRRKVLAEQQGE